MGDIVSERDLSSWARTVPRRAEAVREPSPAASIRRRRHNGAANTLPKTAYPRRGGDALPISPPFGANDPALLAWREGCGTSRRLSPPSEAGPDSRRRTGSTGRTPPPEGVKDDVYILPALLSLGEHNFNGVWVAEIIEFRTGSIASCAFRKGMNLFYTRH